MRSRLETGLISTGLAPLATAPSLDIHLAAHVSGWHAPSVLNASLEPPDEVLVGISFHLPRMRHSHILPAIGHDLFF